MVKYDVVIFGAGPAGSVMARRLAEMGYRVVVIEKMVFPRGHVGVSLSPGVRHWLEVVGLSAMMDEFSFSGESYVLWESDEVVVKKGSGGWHVDRGRFDALLLGAAGAPVIFGNAYPVENVRGGWDVYIKGEVAFSTHFVVAATGRRPLLKGRRLSYLPRMVAGYAHSFTRFVPFIEAGRSHWYWGDGERVFVFADVEEVQAFGTEQDFYEEKMRGCSFSVSAGDFGAVELCTATAYVDELPVGRNFIKIGDAAFTMDPLSAQGVQKALKMAVQGAVVVNTILKGDVDAGVAFYTAMVNREVRQHEQWTRAFYGQARYTEGRFWERRRAVGVSVPDEVVRMKLEDVLVCCGEVVVAPVILGDVVGYAEGVRVREEVFVYLGEQRVVELVRKVRGRMVREAIGLVGIEVVRWLVYNGVMEGMVWVEKD